MRYNWQQPDWPNLAYSTVGLEDLLGDYSQRTGKIIDTIDCLSAEDKITAIIEILVSEANKTSEIEGEYLSRGDVLTAIKNTLGYNHPQEKVKDQRAEGIAELMVDVYETFGEPLSEEGLFRWHNLLMKGNRAISKGAWRSHVEPMQVASGAMGREVVHYEAPPSKSVPGEMNAFIDWFNRTGKGKPAEIKQPVIRAAIAHLYFETIHPFEDGNGRIGRAISEKALSQFLGRPVLLSLSKVMELKKKDYYSSLKAAQRSNEITAWIKYFVETTLEAQKDAEKVISFTLQKTRFFDRFKEKLNERQYKVVQRMLKEGYNGFEGGMNARKYIGVAKTSKATATRDLQDLHQKGIFVKTGGGRSTRYELNL